MLEVLRTLRGSMVASFNVKYLRLKTYAVNISKFLCSKFGTPQGNQYVCSKRHMDQ